MSPYLLPQADIAGVGATNYFPTDHSGIGRDNGAYAALVDYARMTNVPVRPA